MSCRAEDFDEIFGVFTDLLEHPQFRKDRVELARGKAMEWLRRLNDEPEDVARREFRILMYGPSHPYARIPNPQTVNHFKREDLLNWHAFYFHPNQIALSVSGDFQSGAMKEKIRKAFADWPKVDVALPTVPAVAAPEGPRLYYIQRTVDQSQIRIGTLGLARHNHDHFAWEVFNELWGGTDTSRLFRTVRTKQGLAYAVGSAFSEPAMPGLIVAISQTRGPETVAAAQSILHISEATRSADFSDGEIQDAKEAIENRFVENYASSAQIASDTMQFEYYGFPPDYLDTYTRRIGAVTPADLKRAGETYLHPEKATILILGDLSTFAKPISTLGKPQEVKPIDYSQEVP